MVLKSDLRRTLPEVLVGRDRITARRFSLAAVLAFVTFGVLFSLLAWNVLEDNSTIILGVWVLLGGWTVLIPAVYAYKNDGLLVSWLLASVGPFAVGVVLAISPTLTGPQRALVDVLGFALELSLEFALPIGAVGFALGSWARIASDLWRGRNETNQMKDRYTILAGTAFLLVIPMTKLGMNTPEDILASRLDILVLGSAVVGSAVGLILLKLQSIRT